MARFTHETDQDKQDLIARAHKCKPKSIETFATHQGWEHRHPNGNLELLVSFGNLDKLLDGSSESIVVAPEAPVVNLIEPKVETPEEVIDPVVEAPVEEVVEDEEEIESVDVPKKRGRPARTA